MADLILRPDGLKEDHYALQIRHHDCCGPTDYETITRGLTEAQARDIVDCGAPFWLFGDPIKRTGQ